MRWRGKAWECREVCMPGQSGTLGPYQKYGNDLICVRYRYDGKGFRIKTVELVEAIAKVGKKRPVL